MTAPEIFIKDQFPRKKWPVVPTVLKTAYKAAEDLVRDTPFLQVESAAGNKGRLISSAVDFGLVRAIESGSLDCDFRWSSFARPTGQYLELRFSHSTASVSQVAIAAHQPRNVVFRENARIRNQRVFPFPEFEDEQVVTGLPHFLIVHGHQTLDFAHIAVPSSESRSKYAWRSSNLMKLPHEIVTGDPPTEDTDYDLDELELLKEDIERWRRDNDDKE